MCGITGIYAFNMVGRMNMINLASATEKLAHRGPDFQNGYNDQVVGLGHRRLSVIDPSPEGHQPMCDHSERYWLSFNGEVYNFKELREELYEQGVRFRSQTDSEVVLQMLIRYGEEALNRFNGFFSLAFYDRKESRLILAIDRYGIKPLYYFNDQDKFLFSSEMISLLQYGLEKRIDFTALYWYLQLNYVPGPLTMLEGVKKVLPGQLIRVSPEGMEIHQWYVPGTPELYKGSLGEAGKEVYRLLEMSVSDRLVADVPLGSFLSGGLDSSIIAMLARKQKEDLHTYSVTFSEESFFDESHYSNIVARHIGSRHTEFDLTRKKFEDSAESIMNSFSEPFADSSAIAYYLLSKETAGNCTVALSGDGADELFGGYNKHLAWDRMRHQPAYNLLSWAALPFTSVLPSSRSGSGSNFVRQADRYARASWRKGAERYWYLASITSPEIAEKWLSRSGRSSIDRELITELKAYMAQPLEDVPSLNNMLLTDQQFVLPWDMLVKADRMSMAHGLEVRVPFLDHRLVEFVRTLPGDFKLHGKLRKRILHEAFRNELPPEILQRSKRGFEVPLLKWLRESSLKYEVDKLTDETFLKDQGIFDPKKVRKLKRSLKSSNPSDSHARIWAIFVFQWWYRRVFG